MKSLLPPMAGSITSAILQGERADAPIEDADAFKQDLQELLAMYAPKHIYNSHKIGLL